MLKTKLFFIFFALSLVICSFIRAESLELIPNGTQLIKTKTQEDPVYTTTTYKYDSVLSKQNIINFYRRAFSAQGIKEERESQAMSLDQDRLSFSKGSSLKVELEFFDLSQQNTGYYLYLTKLRQKRRVFDLASFIQPQELGFMPVYQHAVQFRYGQRDVPVPMTGVAYLSKDPVGRVNNFYAMNMSEAGWELKSSMPRQGRFKFTEWPFIIAPFLKDADISLENVKADEKLVPKLDIEGITLTFEKEQEKCIITIYKFTNILKAQKGSIYDVSPMAEYGTTVICAFYFPSK